jgi:hypothetical protein
MILKHARLGGGGDRPFCTEIEGYSIGITSILGHLLRLPSVKPISFSSFPMTDDVWLHFQYRDHPFLIESPFAYLWLEADSADVPEEVFRDLERHVLEYRRVSPMLWLKAFWLCWSLPRRPSERSRNPAPVAGPN